MGLIWLVLVVIGALALIVNGCGVAPTAPTATSVPVPTLTPIELVVMYTTGTEGIVHSVQSEVIKGC
jgi:hypothetical protein